LKCKSCIGPHTPEGDCLGPLLSAFSKEYNTKKITVSHYIEKQYYGSSITLLGKITALSNEIENLSLRDPVKEYFGPKAEKDRRRIACTKCGLNPSKLYPKMNILVMRDIVRFHELLRNIGVKIPGFKKKTKYCGRCLSATAEDVNYIFDEYEKLAGFVAGNAFNVVLHGNRSNYPGGFAPQVLDQYLSTLMGYQQTAPGFQTGRSAERCRTCGYPLLNGQQACNNCGTRS
ncbi:MAG: hypothetical protein QGH39_11725, partial [Candidatus Thermoplasmatota archaeon]|nr:hypothetical protein [Candidatus Thermoplasmatota archaeon]